jgi:hypothetical protein
MKKLIPAIAMLFLSIGFLHAEAIVDGKITAGEYAQSRETARKAMTVYWEWDANGGLTIALSAKSTGWVAIGLGSSFMSNAHMFLGFVDGTGKPVFVEQVGKGHSHSDASDLLADSHALASADGFGIMEFHINADQIKKSAKGIPFIVAYSTKADVRAMHKDFDTGTIPLP